MRWSLSICFILLVFATDGQRKMNVARMTMKLGRETNTDKIRSLLINLEAEGERRKHPDKVIFANLFLGELEKRTGDFSAAEKRLIQAYELYKVHFKTRKHNFLLSPRTQYTYFDAIDQLGHFYLYTSNVKKAEQLFLESK